MIKQSTHQRKFRSLYFYKRIQHHIPTSPHHHITESIRITSSPHHHITTFTTTPHHHTPIPRTTTTKPQNHRTAEPQNHITVELLCQGDAGEEGIARNPMPYVPRTSGVLTGNGNLVCARGAAGAPLALEWSPLSALCGADLVCFGSNHIVIQCEAAMRDRYGIASSR